MLVRYTPWNDFDRLERAMTSFFDGNDKPTTTEALWHSSVDVHEDKDRIELVADLPGVEEKDVSISIDKNVLSLKAERRFSDEKKSDGYVRRERGYGSFSRAFTLPNTVDVEKISAELKGGVLKLTLPKKPEAQPRQIKVSSAS